MVEIFRVGNLDSSETYSFDRGTKVWSRDGETVGAICVGSIDHFSTRSLDLVSQAVTTVQREVEAGKVPGFFPELKYGMVSLFLDCDVDNIVRLSKNRVELKAPCSVFYTPQVSDVYFPVPPGFDCRRELGL